MKLHRGGHIADEWRQWAVYGMGIGGSANRPPWCHMIAVSLKPDAAIFSNADYGCRRRAQSSMRGAVSATLGLAPRVTILGRTAKIGYGNLLDLNFVIQPQSGSVFSKEQMSRMR